MTNFYVKKVMLLFLSLLIFITIINCSNNSDRYYLLVNEGNTYKVDKKTGQTWLIKGDVLIELTDVKEKQSNTNSKKLIALANKAETFNRYNDNIEGCDRCKIIGIHTNEHCIKNYLAKQDGIVDTKGWKIIRNIGNNFLIENHFTINGESFQYAVEVNPELSSVKEIISVKQKSYYYPEIDKYLKKIYNDSGYSKPYKSFLTELESIVIQENFEQLVNNPFQDEYLSYSTYIKKTRTGNDNLSTHDFLTFFNLK